MKYTDIKNIIVGSEDLTEVLPIKNRNYVAELVRDHKFPREGHNQYPLFDFIRRYIDYLNEMHIKQIEEIRKLKPSEEKDRFIAKLKELEYEEKKKNSLPKDEVVKIFLDANVIIISSFEGWLIKTAPELLGIDNLQDMQNKLNELGKVYRRQVSDMLNKNDFNKESVNAIDE